MPVNDNSASLASFVSFVEGRRAALKREYDRSSNRDLAKQNSQGLMKRNLAGVLAQLYIDGLEQLAKLSFDTASEASRLSLGEEILRPFDGMIDELLQYALQKHRSSCALSNFPDEHNPSVSYIAEVLDVAEKDFALFKQKVEKFLSGVVA